MVNLNETTKTVTDNSLNQNLLEAYLLFFLPITSNKSRTTIDPQVPAQSLWKSLSSTTSNLLHLGSSEQSIVSQSQPAAKQKSLLLNLKPFNNQSFDSSANLLGTSMTHSRTIDPFGDLACKCETIITIFTEMWLNINVPASLQKKKQNSGQFVTPYCPSIDHMRYVRVLIKHLHYFANSVQEKQHDIMQMPAFEHNDLDDIKKSIWTSKFEIQKKLYSFFKLSFDRWPCDASFLMPLETWLSFIQPWRYMNGNARSTDDNKENGELEEQPSLLSTSGQTLAGAPIIDNRWKHFINDNLLFYTVIFRDLINRFIRIDLGSPKNSYMLFRVCKLFAQTNLTNLIKEVESQFENPNSTSWLASASLRGSLLSPSIRNASQSFRHNDSFVHLIEDTDEFEYHSFFSTHVREHMIRLLAEVQKVRNSKDFQPDPPTTSSASAGFFYSIWKSTFSSNENVDQEHEQLQLAELKRSLGYLDIVFDKFKALFEIDVQELDPSHLVTRTVTFAESVSDNVSFAGTLDTSTETPNERRLLRIRHNQSNVQFQGNPDLQPIRTYEIYYLVLLFQYLSSLINEYYGEQLIRLYYRTDLIGFVVKKLLSPPRDYIQVEKNGPKAERRLKRSLPPRVNLRPLASKALYVYLLSAAVVLFLYRLSGILLLILSFLSLVVILCYKLVESSPPETYGRSKWD